MLTFVIPVRHQATVRDWAGLRDRLAITIRSIQGQRNPRWNAIIVANEGADLPDLPDRFQAIRVDFPPAFPPDLRADEDGFYRVVRRDKGSRLLAGLLRGRVGSHVMLSDCDDLVSNRLAGLVHRQPLAHGWFLDQGWLWSGGEEIYLRPAGFFRFCGTSHIVRADLLMLPARTEDADMAQVMRWLGAHIYIKDDLQQRGTALARLPFPGAIYRLGHPDTTSRSGPVREHLLRVNGPDPAKALAREKNFRPLDAALAAEFFNGPPA